MTKLMKVTDDTFDHEVIRSGKDVVVFCTADWSPPFRKTMPIIAEFAERHSHIKS